MSNIFHDWYLINMDEVMNCPGKPGDLIVVERAAGYQHWAVNVGDGYVVHLTGTLDVTPSGFMSSTEAAEITKKMIDAEVRKDLFSDVFDGKEIVRVDNTMDLVCDHSPPAKIVQRAMSRIGEKKYHMLWSNCEHFAKWCRYKVPVSEQTREFWNGGGGAALMGFAAFWDYISGKN